MSRGILGTLAAWLTVTGLAFGEPPSKPATAPDSANRLAPVPATAQGPTSPNGWPNGPVSATQVVDEAGGGYLSFNAEFLLLVLKHANFIGPVASTDVIGVPSFQPLFGDREISYKKQPMTGTRLSLGYFVSESIPELMHDHPRDMGVEISFLGLGSRTRTFGNDTSAVILRPFFDINNRRESALLVAQPGLSTGTIQVTNTIGGWWGLEANCWRNLMEQYFFHGIRVDGLLGLRYFEEGEDFNFTSTSLLSGTVSPSFANNRITVHDLFATRNQFYGAQVGLAAKFGLEPLEVNLIGKAAIGWNSALINVQGQQVRVRPSGETTVSNGGLLALPSNIGRHHQTMFAVLPEWNMNIVMPLGHHSRLTLGYAFIGLTRSFRPGTQIDRVIDISQVPNGLVGFAPSTGFNRPAVPFRDQSVWAQGVTVGMEITW